MADNELFGVYSSETLADAVFDWTIVDGGWETSIHQLRRFAEFKSHKLSYSKIFESIKFFQHELVLPALPMPSFESIFDLKIKWRAQAGFDYPNTPKGLAWRGAYHDARILWGMFARKYVPACFEWSVGGRWRRNKKQFDYDVESRAVLFNNYSMDLICMIFAQRMTSEFKKLDAHGNFLGHAMQKFGYERYINWRNKPVRNVRTGELLEPNLYIAIDAKSHDSSRTRKHKIIAMSLIRGCFPRGGVVDKFFFAMTYNLCNLKVVTPGGYLPLPRW
jgi:hypothetical protein